MLRIDDVDVGIAEGGVEVLHERAAVVEALEHGCGDEVADRRRRIVHGDLGYDLALFQEICTRCKVICGVLDFFRHAVCSPRGGIERTVRELVPLRVSAEEPVFVHLAAERDGHPGVDIAVAFGAVAEESDVAAVPADLRLRHPEGPGQDGPQKVEGEFGVGE